MSEHTENILEEANRIVGGDRQRDYGHPLENHQRIADLWNTYLDLLYDKRGSLHLEPEDVAWMMILLKAAREIQTPKRDNLVDTVGYARALEMIHERYAAPSGPRVIIGNDEAGR